MLWLTVTLVAGIGAQVTLFNRVFWVPCMCWDPEMCLLPVSRFQPPE